MNLSDWYTVDFDDERIYLRGNSPGGEPWVVEIGWADIVRVCFQAQDLFISDEIYLFTRQRPESYVIPTEAFGGAELWGEIIARGLFDAELAVQAAMAADELFCWPAEKGGATPGESPQGLPGRHTLLPEHRGLLCVWHFPSYC